MGAGVAALPFLDQALTLDLGLEDSAVAAVVGGEAGVGLVGAEDDGLGIRAALDDSADERRDRETPFGVHRVECAPIEEMLQLHGFSIRSLHTDLPCSRTRASASA